LALDIQQRPPQHGYRRDHPCYETENGRVILQADPIKNGGITPPPIEVWESEVNADSALSDWSWLFAYEGIRNGWLQDINGTMSSPFFKAMSDRNVIFYDPSKNVQKSESVKRKRNFERKEQNHEVTLFLEMLRGVNFETNDGWNDY